jgi:hypothetical protein
MFIDFEQNIPDEKTHTWLLFGWQMSMILVTLCSLPVLMVISNVSRAFHGRMEIF